MYLEQTQPNEALRTEVAQWLISQTDSGSKSFGHLLLNNFEEARRYINPDGVNNIDRRYQNSNSTQYRLSDTTPDLFIPFIENEIHRLYMNIYTHIDKKISQDPIYQKLITYIDSKKKKAININKLIAKATIEANDQKRLRGVLHVNDIDNEMVSKQIEQRTLFKHLTNENTDEDPKVTDSRYFLIKLYEESLNQFYRNLKGVRYFIPDKEYYDNEEELADLYEKISINMSDHELVVQRDLLRVKQQELIHRNSIPFNQEKIKVNYAEGEIKYYINRKNVFISKNEAPHNSHTGFINPHYGHMYMDEFSFNDNLDTESTLKDLKLLNFMRDIIINTIGTDQEDIDRFIITELITIKNPFSFLAYHGDNQSIPDMAFLINNTALLKGIKLDINLNDSYERDSRSERKKNLINLLIDKFRTRIGNEKITDNTDHINTGDFENNRAINQLLSDSRDVFNEMRKSRMIVKSNPLQLQKIDSLARYPHQLNAQFEDYNIEPTIISEFSLIREENAFAEGSYLDLYLPQFAQLNNLELFIKNKPTTHLEQGKDYQILHDPKHGYYRIKILNNMIRNDIPLGYYADFDYDEIETTEDIPLDKSRVNELINSLNESGLEIFAKNIQAAYQRKPSTRSIKSAIRKSFYYSVSNYHELEQKTLQLDDNEYSIPAGNNRKEKLKAQCLRAAAIMSLMCNYCTTEQDEFYFSHLMLPTKGRSLTTLLGRLHMGPLHSDTRMESERTKFRSDATPERNLKTISEILKEFLSNAGSPNKRDLPLEIQSLTLEETQNVVSKQTKSVYRILGVSEKLQTKTPSLARLAYEELVNLYKSNISYPLRLDEKSKILRITDFISNQGFLNELINDKDRFHDFIDLIDILREDNLKTMEALEKRTSKPNLKDIRHYGGNENISSIKNALEALSYVQDYLIKYSLFSKDNVKDNLDEEVATA